MREAFYAEVTDLIDDDPRTALVLADISAAALADAAQRHPDRVLNVGIREQLMVSVAGGLALTGMRPIAHSYAAFLIERAWEQVKLDLTHQEVGAILVSVGASYESSSAGRTHHSPGDVALLDTLDGWTVHVPGHPDEVRPALRGAARHDNPVYLRLASQHNDRPHPTDGRLVALRRGTRAFVVAVGPMLDPVLAATAGLDVTVAYTGTPRPFDTEGLRDLAWEISGAPAVVIVEPYLAGTSAHVVTRALAAVPHRLLCLGVGRQDLHRFGTIADHDAAHSLTPGAIRAALTAHPT
ncbi:MAG: transketolase [Micromonosporaceae bacterium]|nr:transketolase [Micromonosporaceae bacterium]